MDYLETLRVFRAVTETGSFTRAGDILGIGAPAVSRAISSLEKRLSSRLFHRSTRQVALTEAGARLLERCTRILEDLVALEADARDQTLMATGLLRIVAHTTATMSLLVPLMSTFKRRYPGVELDVTLLERPVDLAADGYDLGIVLPYMLRSDTVITRLLERIPQVIVASPEYLAQHGTPEKPADLTSHRFVTVSPGIRKPIVNGACNDEKFEIQMSADVASNSPAFNAEMVRAGLGLGILPVPLVHEDVASGRLINVLSGCELSDRNIEIRLAYSSRTLLPAKVRAFIEHASEAFSPSDASNLNM